MNNAELIVQTLKQAGIRHGFGIPSGNVLPMIEAMRTGGINFVLTAHEGSAAFSADVTGRLTGAPGLCIATLGPGATNLTTGVGDAYLDRSPMIALTCTLNTDQIGRRIQMMIDHHALFKPITKATLPLRPGSIRKTVEEAIRIALTEPQGPVHLDLPEDVSLAPISEDPPAESPSVPAMAPPSKAMLEDAHRLLQSARKPVAIVGTTAMRLQNPELLRDFVNRNAMPFGSTTMAKGMIDEHHPLSIGCIERGRRQVQREFLRGADLIVGLGYDTVECEYEVFAGDVPVLHIGIEEADIDATVTVAANVVGNLDAALDGLNALAPAENDWTEALVGAHRQKFQDSLRPKSPGFAPHQAIDIVRAALPRDGILSFDVGAHTHQIASQWTVHAPRSFLITNGWSSMGFGLPGAIAAKIARPDQPVVCILGDGCFQMTCGELATAKRLGLALPVVVLDDRWLSLIQIKQEHRQYGLYGSELQQEEYSTPPAHYFGVPAIGATTPDELERALQAAFAAIGPTVIEAIVDPTHYMDTVFD